MCHGGALYQPSATICGPLRNYKSEISRLQFTVDQAAERSGLTPRQVDFYTRKGYVTPSLRAAPGSGGPSHQRLYGAGDVQELRLLARLRRSGLPPARAAAALRFLREQRIGLPTDRILVTNGREVWLVDDSDNVFDLLRRCQAAFSVFLGVPAPRGARPRVSSSRSRSLPLRAGQARARA